MMTVDEIPPGLTITLTVDEISPAQRNQKNPEGSQNGDNGYDEGTVSGDGDSVCYVWW